MHVIQVHLKCIQPNKPIIQVHMKFNQPNVHI